MTTLDDLTREELLELCRRGFHGTPSQILDARIAVARRAWEATQAVANAAAQDLVPAARRLDAALRDAADRLQWSGYDAALEAYQGAAAIEAAARKASERAWRRLERLYEEGRS